MRLFCFFDLPMDTNKEKRIYRNFRKLLIKDGFEMLQYSVYFRTCPNRSFAKKFEKHIKEAAPPDGHVRLLSVTEKQFNDMSLIIGSKKAQEVMVSDKKLVHI